MAFPAWDDAWFLDRAVCVHRAAYSAAPGELWRCIGTMFKSPVMALLLLPAGPSGQDVAFLGVASFLLACATFTLAAALGWRSWRVGAPFRAAALAALAFVSCAPLRDAGAPFLVDGAFAIFIALLLCLPPLEYGAPAPSGPPALLRGALWGSALGWGLLLKATFLFFALFTAPLLVVVSLQRSGWRATGQKILAALCAALPPGIVFLRFSGSHLGNALTSSFGDGAQYYGPEQRFWTAFADLVASTGWIYWLCCGLLLAGALARRDPPRLIVGLTSGSIALAYLLIVSFSRNEQARFLWCVWVAIPATLACAVRPAAPAPREAARPFAAIAVLIVVAAAPMFARFDWDRVRQAAAILRALDSGGPTRVEIADDPPFLNINTFQLARQVHWSELNRIDVSTVVYQQAEGKSLEYSLERLLAADFVLFVQSAAAASGPDFTNGRRQRFLDFARACGRPARLGETPSDVLIFDMRKAVDCAAPISVQP
jgi:hypothetical protein